MECVYVLCGCWVWGFPEVICVSYTDWITSEPGSCISAVGFASALV